MKALLLALVLLEVPNIEGFWEFTDCLCRIEQKGRDFTLFDADDHGWSGSGHINKDGTIVISWDRGDTFGLGVYKVVDGLICDGFWGKIGEVSIDKNGELVGKGVRVDEVTQ